MAGHAPPDAIARLRRSVERFYAALNASPYGGMSRIADLAYLKVLIDKYPSEARQMIGDANQERAQKTGKSLPPGT